MHRLQPPRFDHYGIDHYGFDHYGFDRYSFDHYGFDHYRAAQEYRKGIPCIVVANKIDLDMKVERGEEREREGEREGGRASACV